MRASSQSAPQDTTARAADAVNNCEKASNGRPVTAGDFCSFMMRVQRIVHAVKPSAPITSLSQQMCTVEKRSVITAWRSAGQQLNCFRSTESALDMRFFLRCGIYYLLQFIRMSTWDRRS
jgi:hypothetical protein